LLLPGAEVFTQALDTIPGWFYPQDVRLFDFVLNCQLENDIRGDVLEVGAYQGKSAILLAYGLRGDENLVVCDLFGLSPDNFDLPAEGMNLNFSRGVIHGVEAGSGRPVMAILVRGCDRPPGVAPVCGLPWSRWGLSSRRDRGGRFIGTRRGFGARQR